MAYLRCRKELSMAVIWIMRREGDQSDTEEVKKTLLLRTLSASYLFGLLYRAVGSLSRVLNKVYKSVF